ncbi:PorV/PorQ family protein [candidate division KSB1 bacterium]|nr:PorV/PorQ family protein [candidate division KSB1 bacterium]
MKKTIFIILIIALLPGLALSQKNVSKVGTAAAAFLEIPVGSPAVGMGGAFVSVANDATALYWNASGITSVPTNEVLVMHNQWIAGTRFNFAAAVLKLGGTRTLGLSITTLSMDDMKVRTIDKPEGTGEYYSAGDLAVGLSYAWELTDRFAIGFTGKFIQQKIWHMSANAVAIDVGTKFRTDLLNGMVIGAAISNFGTSMQLAGRDARRFSRIDETKLGSNGQIPQNIEMDSWDLPLMLQIGVSSDLIKTEAYRWTFAIDALHPSANYESINVGTELAFNEYFFLRGGYQSLFLQDAEGGLCLGVGLTSKMLFSNSVIKFDYAYRDMGLLENTQLFSVSVGF